MMKHIICYSGGHSSALVAIEVYRRYGDVVLLNHDIHPSVESQDIKRFKQEVADFVPHRWVLLAMNMAYQTGIHDGSMKDDGHGF